MLNIYVASGAWNGGGVGRWNGGAGGGATDIRIGGTALTNRVLVAAGGGGGGGENTIYRRGTPGGCGGTPNGCNGADGTAGGAGTGATQSAAGGPPLTTGSLGQGGNGYSNSALEFSGGGGGGWYGGGGGVNTGSGGGGSSYASPAVATNVVYSTGTGSPVVRLRFSDPSAPVISLSNGVISAPAGSVLYSSNGKIAGNAAQLAWDTVNNRLGIGTANPQAKLHVAGGARVDALGGSGARMVTADNNGLLSAQALPTDAQQLTKSGSTISLTNGGAVTDADNQQLTKAGSTISLTNGGSVTDADNQQLSITGATISLTNGGSVTVPSSADNLGNHTATQNINLNGQLLTGGGTSGLFVGNAGAISIPSGSSSSTWFNFSTDNRNYIRGTTLMADEDNASRVGIGTTTPTQKLEVGGQIYSSSGGYRFPDNTVQTTAATTDNLGNHTATQTLQMGANPVQFGLTMGSKVNLWDTDYSIGIQGGTQYFRTGEGFAWFKGGTHSNNTYDAGTGGMTQMVLQGGRLGIGPSFNATASGPSAPLELQQSVASPYILFHARTTAWFSFGQDYADDNKVKISDGNGFGGTNLLTLTHGGYMGIGTTDPQYPLDVRLTTTPANFAYGYINSSGVAGWTGGSTGPVSIRATGRVVGTEFNANSDSRLKSVIGQSNGLADLHLLNKIRITDYTMRDKVQYGDRKFKKVIAQEIEEIFPQAVTSNSGFLPDIYALAISARMETDSVLQLGIPKKITANAGQRLKLIAGNGELEVIIAKASDGNQLWVKGTPALAGQQLFVYGLEHADVRAVDYEALAMLNISATQELARQIAALKTENAALRQQAAACRQAADVQQATTEALSRRLTALEQALPPTLQAAR